MNLIRKISTAMRGSARESAEAFIDANQLRIFEQEILDLERALGVAKQRLTLVVAERMHLERTRRAQGEKIAAREEQAVLALAADQGELARQLAVEIVEQQRLAASGDDAIAQLRAREEALLKRLRVGAGQIGRYRQELRLARAVAHSQAAAAQVGGSTDCLDQGIEALAGSLSRINETQRRMDDRLAAAEELEGRLDGGLDERLARAGLVPAEGEVQAVLARLRGVAPAAGVPAAGVPAAGAPAAGA